MGSQLLGLQPDQRETRMRELIIDLSRVDWTKGKHWEGIAGGTTDRGVFSVKGTKEVAYAVYNALAEPASNNYQRVRPPTEGEATSESSAPPDKDPGVS